MADGVNSAAPDRTYRCPTHVGWVVEDQGVTLVNRGTGATLLLKPPDAATWDLMSRGQSYAGLVSLLCSIVTLTPECAAQRVRACVASWVSAGFLEEVQ